MEFDATFWAFIALILFFVLAIVMKVPAMVTGMLDRRIDAIRSELAEARRLREEAEALLASYERKRVQAEQEAQEIVASAREDAARLAADAEAALGELVTRRTKAVEDKIAQVEAQAIADVRARATDVAIEAARLILADQARDQNDRLVDSAIADVGARLN